MGYEIQNKYPDQKSKIFFEAQIIPAILGKLSSVDAFTKQN